jgi:hypothetical protein
MRLLVRTPSNAPVSFGRHSGLDIAPCTDDNFQSDISVGMSAEESAQMRKRNSLKLGVVSFTPRGTMDGSCAALRRVGIDEPQHTEGVG